MNENEDWLIVRQSRPDMKVVGSVTRKTMLTVFFNLKFEIELEAENGSVWLRLTGRDRLAGTLGTADDRSLA